MCVSVCVVLCVFVCVCGVCVCVILCGVCVCVYLRVLFLFEIVCLCDSIGRLCVFV